MLDDDLSYIGAHIQRWVFQYLVSNTNIDRITAERVVRVAVLAFMQALQKELK
jgi:hypothetical protein